MGLPAGAGLALNVRSLFAFCLLSKSNQFPCQPSIGAIYYKHLKLEKHWEKRNSNVQVFLEEPQVDSKLC